MIFLRLTTGAYINLAYVTMLVPPARNDPTHRWLAIAVEGGRHYADDIAVRPIIAQITLVKPPD